MYIFPLSITIINVANVCIINNKYVLPITDRVNCVKIAWTKYIEITYKSLGLNTDQVDGFYRIHYTVI